MPKWIAILLLLVVGLVVACRAPADDGAATPSVAPGGPTPVAPAIETEHPDAERTIPLPTP